MNSGATSGPPTSVIVAGARTPMGRLLGALSGVSAVELGAVAIAAALGRAGVEAGDVQALVLGQVLQAGAGQMPARQAGLRAGLPARVHAMNINKVCLSGIAAIAWADLAIRSGLHEVVVAGGMESMSRAPHLLQNSRTGTTYGDAVLKDHMAHDGLWDAATEQSMGALTEAVNANGGLAGPRFSRSEQDAFGARSHQRAAKAWADGVFDAEVVPVPIPQRKGDPLLVSTDEGIRAETSPETLARLRPAFAPEGTITAGSSSPISDGAAALVVMSRARAEALGLPWLAEIVAQGSVAGPDSTLQAQPAGAIANALSRAGLSVGDLDLVEINEAFAVVALASIEDLGLDPEKVNIHGGALAMGHPIGMSGARIVLHLALALAARGGGVGAAALCGGGGQGDALIIRVPATA